MFKASLNETVADPCDNFTAFVCDGWTRHNKYSVRQKLAVNALRTMSELSRVAQTATMATTPAEGAMAFFRSCDAVLRGDTDQLHTVKRLLAEANITWPRRATTPDVLETLLHTSVKLRLSPLFNIEIDMTVDYGTDVFLMPFDDSRLLRRKFDFLYSATEGEQRAYFNLLRDRFGSTKAQEREVTFEEVADLSISMLVPMFESLKKQSIPDVLLQDSLATSRWESGLALYGVKQKPITYSTEALPYIEKFFELWSVYGETKTHLLVSWCAIQIAALYANQELIVNYYGSEERALVEHGAFCLSKAYLIGKFSLFADYTAHILYRNGRRDLEEIAHNVRRAFHSRLQAWLYYEPVRTVVADWDSVATVFNAFDAGGGNIANDTQLYPVMGDSLAENWKNAAITMKTMRSDKVFMTLLSSGLHVVFYNDFVLLPFAASFPLYNVDATDAVKYGGIGKEMALSLSGLFYDTYWRFSQANHSIANVSKCMGGPQALTNNLEAVAINALYDAFKDASAGRDIRLVGLEKYTASQIFFIASCYAKCPGSMDISNEDCNTALRHVQAFTIAFRCLQRDFMNPEERCHLF
ncbi:uncharacterized protein LOC144180538 isoform X2 [Haemaphysalis longicornis]